MRTRLILASVFFVAVVVAGCGGPQKDRGGLRPDSSQFASEWVNVTMGGMMASPGKNPSLTLNLKNTSRRAIWVEVEFTTPDGSQNCKVDKKLDVSGGGMFMCAQSSLVQDEDYPVLVHVYGDADKTTLLESTQTKLRFDASDVAKFNALLTSRRSAQRN